MLKTASGPREISAGDRMVFTRNEREIGVKNGGLGTVIAAEASRVTVRLDEDGGGHVVRFDPRRFDGFDHGYAVTIHKSQGVTVDRAYVLASRVMGDSLAYVAMSRHREALKIYASRTDRPAWLSLSGLDQERDERSRLRVRRDPTREIGPSLDL